MRIKSDALESWRNVRVLDLIDRMQPLAVAALFWLDHECRLVVPEGLMITSLVSDRGDIPGRDHQNGLAWDIRTRNMTGSTVNIIIAMSKVCPFTVIESRYMGPECGRGAHLHMRITGAQVQPR